LENLAKASIQGTNLWWGWAHNKDQTPPTVETKVLPDGVIAFTITGRQVALGGRFCQRAALIEIEELVGSLFAGEIGADAAYVGDGYRFSSEQVVVLLDDLYFDSFPLLVCACFSPEEIALTVRRLVGDHGEVLILRQELRPDEFLREEFTVERDFDKAFALEPGIIELVAKWCPDLDYDYVQMGLHEILANAVEHAQGEGPIRVTVTQWQEHLCISIQDGGAGFDWKSQLTNGGDILDSPSDRGRGIQLTSLCFDRVIYNVRGDKVCLLKKTVTPPGGLE
jgi:anti-sigma regulatory factor (Ser/Thr protein kinase)